MFFIRRYIKTNFNAGGLKDIPAELLIEDKFKLKLPQKNIPPRKLDFRDMCLSSNNQGNTNHCAGYAIAGHIEVNNWKIKHYPEQIDGDLIYKEAKKIEGDTSDNGTTLDCAAKAAIKLKYTSGNVKIITDKACDTIKFTIHQYCTCAIGFMINNAWNYVNKKTGIISEETSINMLKLLGGHAVLLCGYDSDGVYIQNSWGKEWGHYGFAKLTWKMYEQQFLYAVIIE